MGNNWAFIFAGCIGWGFMAPTGVGASESEDGASRRFNPVASLERLVQGRFDAREGAGADEAPEEPRLWIPRLEFPGNEDSPAVDAAADAAADAAPDSAEGVRFDRDLKRFEAVEGELLIPSAASAPALALRGGSSTVLADLAPEIAEDQPVNEESPEPPAPAQPEAAVTLPPKSLRPAERPVVPDRVDLPLRPLVEGTDEWRAVLRKMVEGNADAADAADAADDGVPR